MEIKNELLKEYLQSLDEERASMESIDLFGSEIDNEGMVEYFKLLETGEASLFSLKVYSMVYNPEIIAVVDSKMPFNFVDMTFGAMWKEEAEDATVDELKEAVLGFVLIGTDLTKRIRNGYRQLGYDLEKFEEQIEELVKSYKEDIDNGIFIKEMSQTEEDISDELLEEDLEDLESLKSIRDRVLFATTAYQYKDSDSVKERQAMIESVDSFDFMEEDLFFLDQKYHAILNDIKMSKAVMKADTDYINKDEQTPSLGGLLNEVKVNDASSLMIDEDDDIMEMEITKDIESGEASIIKNLKNMVSSPKKSDKGDFGGLTMKSTRNKKQSSFKITFIMIALLMILGITLTAITQKDKTNNDVSLSEQVVENQVDSTIKENFKINRSGTNKDE